MPMNGNHRHQIPNRFFLPKNNYRHLTKFYEDLTQDTDRILKKYQEIWDRATKYHFGINIILVYQIFGYQLTSLLGTECLLSGSA